MLVLTRKRDELITIGENIVVKVISTGRGSVKIGIDAPKEVRILRAELCPRIDGEALDTSAQPVAVEVLPPQR